MAFKLSEQNCLSNNSNFSAIRRFQDEPLILLQRLISLESELFNTSQIFILNHVDLITVFLMTAQRSPNNVLDGAVNHHRLLLVIGILMPARPPIVCWIIRHLWLVKVTGSLNQTAVWNATII